VGWVPIFPRLATSFTEVGAPYTHAAIVVCELDFPVVMGYRNAPMLLKTDGLVHMDGGSGTVEILETTKE
jgi:pyruvate,water dikinase